MDFADKVVVISGATGGIAVEIAKKVASEGAHLALFSRREKELQQLCEYITERGAQCVYHGCDVTIQDDVKKAVDLAMDTYGRIDVAILTAGVLIPNPIEMCDSSIITKSMEINFFGIVKRNSCDRIVALKKNLLIVHCGSFLAGKLYGIRWDHTDSITTRESP